MKKLRLRYFVVNTLIILLFALIIYSGTKIYDLLSNKEDYIKDDYVDMINTNRIVPTISVNDEIIKPYDSDDVTVKIPYYNMNDEDSKQQESLILYENIYMQNTGIMYGSNNKFNVLAVMDGTIKDIKDDSIMGKIIEIEHNSKLSTIYQSVDEVNVSVGQKVTQGQIIATSKNNSILDSNIYALHFEVCKDGQLINPDTLFSSSLEELND